MCRCWDCSFRLFTIMFVLLLIMYSWVIMTSATHTHTHTHTHTPGLSAYTSPLCRSYSCKVLAHFPQTQLPWNPFDEAAIRTVSVYMCISFLPPPPSIFLCLITNSTFTVSVHVCSVLVMCTQTTCTCIYYYGRNAFQYITLYMCNRGGKVI